MRDPERIDHLLTLLGCLWEHVPDMRFGQLVTALLNEVEDYRGKLFYLEDDELEQALIRFDNRVGCGAARGCVHVE